MRFEADSDLRVGGDGHTLVGGSPLRIVRLAPRAAHLVTRLVDGVDGDSLDGAELAAVRRLVVSGAVHLRPTAAEIDDADADRLGVVVPVRDRPAELGRCLAALVRSGLTKTVVVDDGSVDEPLHRAIAAEHGATLVRLAESAGPAAARMAGVEALDTPLVGFVDSDVEVTPGWWRPLVALVSATGFADGRVAVAAPRVAAAPLSATAAGSTLCRYEQASSPLDMGPLPSPVRRGARVAYVPAAALVVRRDALDDVGGFDASKEVGEDVDLVWRLDDAGWSVRYEPMAHVRHDVRDGWLRTLRRRAAYGRSAAILDRDHGGSVPALSTTPWSAAVVLALAGGHPVAAGGVAAWSGARLAARLSAVPSARPIAARLVLTGHGHAIAQSARALWRPWWPVSLPLAVCSRRARRVVTLGALLTVAVEWRRRRPALDPLRFGVAALADDLAYSAGVWQGSVRSGHYGALMLRLSTHDRRAR